MTLTGLRAAFHALITSWLRHERGRTLLTVLGIALGVAVLVAIDLANRSAVQSFKDTLDAVAGRASLTIRGNGIGLPANLLPAIAATPGVRSVAPLIAGHATYTPPGGGPPETLMLLGVDLLGSEEQDQEPVRELSLALAPGRNPRSLVSDPGAAVFTRRFVERAGARLGDPVDLEIAGRRRPLTVAAWIESGPLSTTLDGRILVADIGVVDALLGRKGRIDRFDLSLAPEVDADAIAASLRERLPANALVERPETRRAEADRMTAAFRFNLDMLGRIAILVGAFLIYNTMSIAVARRRAAIGTLRALGLRRRIVALVFLAEGVAFGVLGGLAGLALGLVLARGLLAAVATAVSINFFETAASEVVVAPATLAAALAFAIGVSLAAALAPAREAATTPPANTLRRGTLEGGRRGIAIRSLGGLTLIALTVLLAQADVQPGQGLPLRGYLAAATLLAGALALSRPTVLLLARALRRLYARAFGAEGLLAVAGTEAALGRATAAVAGLVVAVAMTVAIGVMVGSFRDTVVRWMGQVLRADLYVVPLAPISRLQPEPLPAALAERIAAIPGIEAVDPFRARRITLRGREAWLGAGALDVVRFTSESLDGRPATAVLREAKQTGALVLSEALARKLGLGRGDYLVIPTPVGEREFRIAGAYRDYSSEQGFAIMDRELYLELFDDPDVDSIALYLEPGADRSAVRSAIDLASSSLPGIPPIAVRANDELREAALAAFNRTFAITWTLELIAVVVAMLGVASTLLAQILDRRDEIAALRWLGATRRRIGRIVLLEASLVGLTGTLLGAATGIGLSWILSHLIMLESFGWTISHRVAPGGVLAVSAVVFVATLLSGLVPAREAARVGTVTRLGGGR